MNTLHHYDPDNPYPDSDGLPMAENTEQYDWLVKIKENLEILFADRADVFIAGDLFWYPVPDRKLTPPLAPDIMVVLGRPKGKRGSYRQWEEDGIAPQVVFEIVSPSNTAWEMKAKKNFYDQYGVQEYYVYNPDNNKFEVWMRQNEHLHKMAHIHGLVSLLLGIQFKIEKHTLRIFYPSGQPFLNSVELYQYAEAQRREKEQERLEKERERWEKWVERREKERERREKNAAILRATAAEQNAETERQEKEAALAEIERLRALLTNKSM